MTPLRSVPAALCFALLLAASQTGVRDLAGQLVHPLSAQQGAVNVLLFVRSDCPLMKRYAPEVERIAREFANRPVRFWLVFPDRTETPATIRGFVADYSLPGTAVTDPKGELVQAAHATVAPEAAVFSAAGQRVYHGRIDDRYIDFGKSRPVAQVHDLENAITAALSGRPVAQAETRAVGCALADIE